MQFNGHSLVMQHNWQEPSWVSRLCRNGKTDLDWPRGKVFTGSRYQSPLNQEGVKPKNTRKTYCWRILHQFEDFMGWTWELPNNTQLYLRWWETDEQAPRRRKIHQFLMGLDLDLYGTACSNVLSLEPLPNLNKVYAFIATEERQQAVAKGMETRDLIEGAAFKVTASTNRGNWSNIPLWNSGRPRCSHCNKPGHEKEQCYELLGYLANWGTRRNSQPNQGRGRANLKLWSSENGGRHGAESGQIFSGSGASK